MARAHPHRSTVLSGVGLWLVAAACVPVMVLGVRAHARKEAVRRAAGEREVRAYFGEAAWHGMNAPDRVEVHRVQVPKFVPMIPDAKIPRLDPYFVGGPVTPKPEWITRLRTALLDRDHYDQWHMLNACEV